MFFERDAELFGAFANVWARDALGEKLVFHAALHGVDLEVEDAFRRTNVGAGGQKASQFITSEERVLEGGLAGDVAIIGVRENGADNFFGVTLLAQDLRAFGGVALVGGMLVIGPALVVEVVQQRGEAPGLFVGAGFTGIGAHAGFDGKHVLTERFGLRVFAEQFPGLFARRHSVLPNKERIV